MPHCIYHQRISSACHLFPSYFPPHRLRRIILFIKYWREETPCVNEIIPRSSLIICIIPYSCRSSCRHRHRRARCVRTVTKRTDNLLFVLVCISSFQSQAGMSPLSLMIIRQNDNVFHLTPNFLTVLTVYCLHTISFRGKAGQDKAAQAPQDRIDIFMRRLEFVLIMSAMPGMLGWLKFLEALNRKVLSYPFDDNLCELIIDVTPTEDQLISASVTTSTTTSNKTTTTTSNNNNLHHHHRLRRH